MDPWSALPTPGGPCLKVSEVRDGDSSVSNDICTSLEQMRITDTVETLKRQITHRYGIQDDDWKHISLSYAQTELDNDGKQLMSYGIELGDTIFFARNVCAPQTVIPEIRFMDGGKKEYCLHNIPRSWTVSQLVEKIAAEKSIPTDIPLHYRGKVCKLKQTLADLNFIRDLPFYTTVSVPGG